MYTLTIYNTLFEVQVSNISGFKTIQAAREFFNMYYDIDYYYGLSKEDTEVNYV